MCIGGPTRDPAVDAELKRQREEQTEMDRIASGQRKEARGSLIESAKASIGAVGLRSARQTSLLQSVTPQLGSTLQRGGTGRGSLLTGGSGGIGFYNRFEL